MSAVTGQKQRLLVTTNDDGKGRRWWTRLILLLLLLLFLVATFIIAMVALIHHAMSIDALNRDVDILTTETADLIERTGALETKVVGIMDNVTVVQGEVANHTQRLETIETKLDGVMNNVTDVQDTISTLITNTTAIQETIDTLITNTTTLQNLVDSLVSAAPIHGWMLFWWEDPAYGNKHSWARFNETTGVMVGTQVPYSPSEARQSSPPGKSQFSRGPNPNDMIYLVFSDSTNLQYLVRHNPAAGTYLQTYLGANPTNHGPAFVVDYDPLNARYIAVSWSTIQSFAHCLVIIDENTGVITPLSGAGGTLAPAPMNNVLDMEVIADYVLIFERYDDDNANPTGMTNRILFYNSTDGQYMSQSFHNGSYAAYPGTFLSANLQNLPTGFHVRWFVAASYDPATFRLHVVLGVSSAGYQREVGWIQGTSEADLLSQLLSGNYVINIVQHQNPFQLNAGVFLTPAV